jgi:putative ABC transport system permease protein
VWRATLKGLLAHKLRLALTSLAVVLGVAFVAGSFILTDTLNATFTKLFAEANAGTDVIVRAVAAFDQPPGGGTGSGRERISSDLIQTVDGVNGVKAAAGSLAGYAQLVGSDGEAVSGSPGAPNLGVAWTDNKELNPLVIRDGRGPEADGELVVDLATATKNDIAVGDRLRVLFQGPAEEFTVVGLVGFGDADNLAGATLVSFTLPTAQRVFQSEGLVDEIAVEADPGVTSDELLGRIAPVLPPKVEVVTGKTAADEAAQQVQQGLSFFNIALLVFAGIALFVGAFIIFNTFSIIVAQRTRELAMLRALGATRGQVTRSVMAEALIVGLVSSVIGIGLGFLVAIGLQALLDAFGLALPSSAAVFKARTLIAGLLVGVLTTFVASVFPAIRASRVPPVAAMRDAEPSVSRFSTRRLVAGLIVLALGVAVLLIGLFAGGSTAGARVGLGAMVTFIGVAVLSPLIARPLSRWIGAPLALFFGQPGKLGRDNAMRNPRRTASTATALMIGLGLVAFVAIFAASLKASSNKILDETLKADFVITTSQFTGFTPQVAADLEALPELSAVSEFRQAPFRFHDQTKFVGGTNPDTIEDTVTLDVVSGSVEGLNDGGVLVFQDEAEANGWTVGDTIPMEFIATGVQQVPIVGIYAENRLVGSYLVSLDTFEQNVTEQLDFVVVAKIAPGVTPDDARAAVDRVTEGYPNVTVNDQTEFKAQQADQIDQLLGLISALLGLAILIAFFGIVNTLALSIFERTREIGLLRAVGMTRRQVRSMVRWESVIIAVLGAALGIAVGIFFGWALVAALADQGISELAVPVGQLVLYVVIAAVFGVLAAIGPARRASRLDILRAITVE